MRRGIAREHRRHKRRRALEAATRPRRQRMAAKVAKAVPDLKSRGGAMLHEPRAIFDELHDFASAERGGGSVEKDRHLASAVSEVKSRVMDCLGGGGASLSFCLKCYVFAITSLGGSAVLEGMALERTGWWVWVRCRPNCLPRCYSGLLTAWNHHLNQRAGPGSVCRCF